LVGVNNLNTDTSERKNVAPTKNAKKSNTDTNKIKVNDKAKNKKEQLR